jgi:hypothetical protein
VIARPAKAGLHLIGDAQASVLANDPVYLFQIIPRAMGDAAGALDRLGDEPGDFT